MNKLPVALVLGCWVWVRGVAACPAPDWPAASKAYDVFLGQPSEANAGDLIAKLPACTPDVDPDNKYWKDFSPDAGVSGRDYERYHELIKLAQAGNVGAIRMMFRLEWLYDGEEADVLGTDMGKISDMRPSEFLKAYAAGREDVRDLDGDLTSLAPEYIDDIPAQIKKLTQRYDGLKLVKSVSKDAKEDCLKVLKRQIAALKEALQASGPE